MATKRFTQDHRLICELDDIFDDELTPKPNKQPKIPKKVGSRYKEGDYAALADFIINGHRDDQLVPTRDYDNTPCPKCDRMTGNGQYIERNGAIVCTHCRTLIHPSYFNADEDRAAHLRKIRIETDHEDLIEILNCQGLKWVLIELFEYANKTHDTTLARELATLNNRFFK